MASANSSGGVMGLFVLLQAYVFPFTQLVVK